MSAETQYRYMATHPGAGTTTVVLHDRTIRTEWNPLMEQYQQHYRFHGKKELIFTAKFRLRK